MKTPTMEAEDRLKLLIKTIFEQKRFTYEELIQIFRKKTGGSVGIGIFTTIHEVLTELVESNLLHRRGDVYFPQKTP